VIGWTQPTTTGETLDQKVVVRHVAWPDNGLLVGDDVALETTNTENDLEIKRDRE
jgi:hypothetical protein